MKRLGLGILAALAITGCTHHDATGGTSATDNLPDAMVLVKASGSITTLLNHTEARFTYDYYLGRHEVTCSEYGAECADSLPMTDVTFYDAVLFANRQSLEQGFDSVYTYDSVQMDGSHHVTFLKNFTFHPEVRGYRLPTEAEWVFAAKGFDPENSWNADNSDYKAHEVCAFGGTFCDMAGNVAEWVGDFNHKLSDTTVVDFVGPHAGGDLGERMLKGGNFRNRPTAMNVLNRKDIYTVTSSTYADYVGFRLAFGAIPHATWVGDTVQGITLDADSAGAYYVSGGSENAIMLRYKMELLWKYCETSKLVILGSSRSLYGVNPLLLDSNLTALNLSHIPNSLYVSDYLLRNYVLHHLKNLKYAVLSLDIDMWWRSKDDSYDNFFLSEYKSYPGYVYDEHHQFWKEGLPEGLLEKTEAAPGFDYFAENFRPTRGFIAESGNAWGEASVDYDSTWLDKTPELYRENLEALKGIISLAKEYNVQVIGIIFPQNPGYRNTGAYGRYGPRQSQADSLLEELKDLTHDYDNFTLMDEYQGGNHDYTDEMAANSDHLNSKGAKQLTDRLSRLLAKIGL